MHHQINTLHAKLIKHSFADYLKLFFLLALCLISLSAFSNDRDDIDNILSMSEPPKGVVFELIGRENSQYLPQALSKIETYKTQLQSKFPDIKIAVVAHGAEQFELTKSNAKKEQKSHNLVKRIVANDVPVHICATHASWRNISGDDFPDYISVSAQGPAQIKKYQASGYLLVIVD